MLLSDEKEMEKSNSLSKDGVFVFPNGRQSTSIALAQLLTTLM